MRLQRKPFSASYSGLFMTLGLVAGCGDSAPSNAPANVPQTAPPGATSTYDGKGTDPTTDPKPGGTGAAAKP